jgi:hypothetical protein
MTAAIMAVPIKKIVDVPPSITQLAAPTAIVPMPKAANKGSLLCSGT